MILIPCFYFMAPTTTIDTYGIRVKISALTPAVLTGGFCGLPQLLQANIAVIGLPKITSRRLLFIFFPVH